MARALQSTGTMPPHTPRRPYFLDSSTGDGRAPEAHVVRPAAFAQGSAPTIRPLFPTAVLEPLQALAPLEPLEPLEPFAEGPSEEPLPPLAPEETAPTTPVMDLTPPSLPPELAARLEAAIARVEALASQLREQAALDALDLGVELARRLLKAELSARPEAVLPSLRDAVSRLAGAPALTLRLHPDDAATLAQGDAAARLGVPDTVVRVVADEALGRGDCVADDGHGVRVEASAEARLARVREALAEDLS